MPTALPPAAGARWATHQEAAGAATGVQEQARQGRPGPRTGGACGGAQRGA